MKRKKKRSVAKKGETGGRENRVAVKKKRMQINSMDRKTKERR